MHNGDIEAIACPLLIEEVRENIQKPYFAKRLNDLEAREGIDAYVDLCVMLEDPETEPLLRDADDDYLVALARVSDAEAIVTGDGDLLDHADLNPPAINPRAACELMSTAGPNDPETPVNPRVPQDAADTPNAD